MLKISRHAQERMEQRNIRLFDIVEAIELGNAKESKGNLVVRNKVSVRNDYPLQVVYAVNGDEIVIISCYWKGLND